MRIYMATNASFFKDWKEIFRTPCEIYLRCMWYIRNIKSFNIWKRSEAFSRRYFDINKAQDDNIFLLKRKNAKFIEQYS